MRMEAITRIPKDGSADDTGGLFLFIILRLSLSVHLKGNHTFYVRFLELPEAPLL